MSSSGSAGLLVGGVGAAIGGVLGGAVGGIAGAIGVSALAERVGDARWSK